MYRSLLRFSTQDAGLRSEEEFGMLEGEIGLLLICSSWFDSNVH